jgi:hypothetical protein
LKRFPARRGIREGDERVEYVLRDEIRIAFIPMKKSLG